MGDFVSRAASTNRGPKQHLDADLTDSLGSTPSSLTLLAEELLKSEFDEDLVTDLMKELNFPHVSDPIERLNMVLLAFDSDIGPAICTEASKLAIPNKLK